MKLTSDMKNLTANILSSFKERVKENELLVSEVQKTLEGFQKDHQEMTAVLTSNAKALRAKLDQNERSRVKDTTAFMQNVSKENVAMSKALRADLNTGEKNRMNEFDLLMKTINEDIVNINIEVSNIFKDTTAFMQNVTKGHVEMSKTLRADLNTGEKNRISEFDHLMKTINEDIVNINIEVSNIFKDTTAFMQNVSKEHVEMSKTLRKSLNTGEDERMNDNKKLMKEIHTSISEIQKEVRNIQKTSNGLVGNYAKDREGATALWNKMTEVLAQLRRSTDKASTSVTKHVAAKTKTESLSPVITQKVEPIETVLLTLEQKIVKYISQHPNGVKISEMEEPLGESRMKLGFIAKSLLEDNKLQKIDNLFYLQN